MATSLSKSPKRTAVPALEGGDHLTHAEFRRRYEQRHDLKKAELIDGVVYVPSPARFTQHAEPHALLVAVVGAYRLATPGASIGDNATVYFEDGSEVQPDLLLRLNEGGRSTLDEDGYLQGPPEFAAEIAASSATYDLHVKKRLYERMGVQEYLVWRTEDEAIDYWQLVDGAYQPITPDAAGVLHSVVFPGLVIDAPTLLAAVREAVKAGS